MSEATNGREFLKGAALGTLGVSALGAAAMGAPCTSALADGSDAGAAPAEGAVVDGTVDITDRLELAVPAMPNPYEASYEVDVVVVGCGIAGLHAAAGAAEAGASVLVVEKGTPGYGGLTPFAGGTAYFKDDADLDTTLKATSLQNEYICNQNWVHTWAEDSGAYLERNMRWGLHATYPEPAETEFWKTGYFEGSAGEDDQRGYVQSPEVAPFARQQRFVEVLDGYGITHLEHTMVCDVVEAEGRVAGAVALHVPSGELITITCKAVILCAGSGTVKPAGYPLGGATFDATYIAYQHGLPVAGMEFEDYHLAWSEKPGCVLTTSGWDYSEPFHANGLGWTADTPDEKLVNGGYLQKINYQYATEGLATPDRTHYGAKHTPTTGWNAPGAAPGFPPHMTGGVFTATKADEGMRIDFVEMPKEWVGDTEAAYEVRYPGYRFYGEAAAKGLEEAAAGGW